MLKMAFPWIVYISVMDFGLQNRRGAEWFTHMSNSNNFFYPMLVCFQFLVGLGT